MRPADVIRRLGFVGSLLGLLLLLGACIFAHRDLLGVDIMEARNLITAREMIDSGHWLLPTLHGEPRLAKPPLPTWATAWAMQLGNAGLDTDLAVDRIPSALAGFLLAVSLYGLTRFWSRSAAAAGWATAFLSTSYMFVLMSRRNSWDIYCHAFMLAAIWGLAVIIASSRPRRALAVLSGVLVGLSGLSKGPVSYYTVLFPFLLAVLGTGGWKGMWAHRKEVGVALGIGVVLSLIWPVGAWIVLPHDFSRMVVIEQSAWFEAHTKSFWFYLQFPSMTGVWSLLGCAVLWPGFARKQVDRFVPYMRLLIWVLTCVVLLMLVPEKKDRYLLPVLIPLCQLMGVYLAGLLEDSGQPGRWTKILLWGNSIVFGLLCVAVPGVLWMVRDRFPELAVTDLALLALAGVFGAALLFRLCRADNLRSLFVVKFFMLGTLCVIVPVILKPPPGDMSVPLTEIRAFAAATPVYCDSSLKFQDYWVIGAKPQRLDTSDRLNFPATFCLVSRKERPVILDNYVQELQLIVSDVTGQSLYLWRLQQHHE